MYKKLKRVSPNEFFSRESFNQILDNINYLLTKTLSKEDKLWLKELYGSINPKKEKYFTEASIIPDYIFGLSVYSYNEIIDYIDKIHERSTSTLLTFEEAEKLVYMTQWKVATCGQKNCWCRIIEPIKKIYYREDITFSEQEFCIVGSGCITKQLAAYIVKLHNENLTKNK